MLSLPARPTVPESSCIHSQRMQSSFPTRVYRKTKDPKGVRLGRGGWKDAFLLAFCSSDSNWGGLVGVGYFWPPCRGQTGEKAAGKINSSLKLNELNGAPFAKWVETWVAALRCVCAMWLLANYQVSVSVWNFGMLLCRRIFVCSDILIGQIVRECNIREEFKFALRALNFDFFCARNA